MATFADNSVANFFFLLAMATKMVAAWNAETGNIAGNLTKIFQKSQMPGGLPGGGGGMGGFGINRYIIARHSLQLKKKFINNFLTFFKFPSWHAFIF